MPEIMTIEGLLKENNMNYGTPYVDGLGMGVSTEDLKEIALLAGAGFGALLAGGLTNYYPETTASGTDLYAKYARPGLKIAGGVLAFYGLRGWNPGVANVAAAVLAGSGLLQLVKPHLATLPLIGPALADIVVQDRTLGMDPAARAYLSEVMQESVELLPPHLAEVMQEDLEGFEDEDFEDEDFEEASFMPGAPDVSGVGSWVC